MKALFEFHGTHTAQSCLTVARSPPVIPQACKRKGKDVRHVPQDTAVFLHSDPHLVVQVHLHLHCLHVTARFLRAFLFCSHYRL